MQLLRFRFGSLTSKLMLAIALSGCGDPLVTSQNTTPVIPTYKPAAQSVGLRSLELVPFRAFDAKGDEITGAICSVDTAYFSLTLSTPAVANLPSFGPETPPLEVECRIDERSVQVTVPTFNLSAERRAVRAAGLVGGAFGTVAGGIATERALNSGIRTNDILSYKPVSITFP
ncbi:hypothetical protein [Cognatiyoonia sp. IB215182]|uniref:hypothetical protein n=1 Tax=Cognatiyoonia sp. IB215182 TaxID=3097353 RepID=UPI002A0C0DD4|nr:hypothetical protein [Cognatiyoonia sp. IB215182]MDX8352979.1 hypothetical protein [Cognatiyoonia sp. IB215182]